MKKNVYINLFFIISIGILGFYLNKIFYNTMGKETLGLLKLFTQLVVYLNLAELGISTAASSSLYKPISQNNYKKINIIISTIDLFYKRIAIFIVIIGFILSFFINNLVQSNDFGYLLYIYWILFVFNTAISYSFSKYSILFLANQEYSFVRIIQGSSSLLSMLLGILVLMYFQSFLFYIIALMVSNLIQFSFYKKHYKKYYSYIKKVKERSSKIVVDMKNLFWHKIGTVVVFNTDYILLSLYTSLSIVAVYSTYLMVYTMIVTIVGLMTPILTPVIGKYIATNNKFLIYMYWNKLHMIYVYISTIVVIVSYYMFNPFIELWMGKDFLLPMQTLILLLINLYIQLTRVMLEIFKTNSGYFHDIYNPILESIINLIISLLLVQKFGLNGVIIGTICSNIITIYILKPMTTFIHCFDKRIKDYILVYSKYIFLTLLSIYITSFFINYFYKSFSISSWLIWIYTTINILLLAMFINTIIFLLDSNFRNLLIYQVKKIKG